MIIFLYHLKYKTMLTHIHPKLPMRDKAKVSPDQKHLTTQ